MGILDLEMPKKHIGVEQVPVLSGKHLRSDFRFHLDEAFLRQHFGGLPQYPSANTQFFAEAVFRGQHLPGTVSSVNNLLAEFLNDILIQLSTVAFSFHRHFVYPFGKKEVDIKSTIIISSYD